MTTETDRCCNSVNMNMMAMGISASCRKARHVDSLQCNVHFFILFFRVWCVYSNLNNFAYPYGELSCPRKWPTVLACKANSWLRVDTPSQHPQANNLHAKYTKILSLTRARTHAGPLVHHVNLPFKATITTTNCSKYSSLHCQVSFHP